MSKIIKVRRGEKADLPTLSLGEFGLTTDTNELFIGGTSGNVTVETGTEVGDLLTLWSATNDNTIKGITAPPTAPYGANTNKVMIIEDPANWSVNNSGADPLGSANQFHFAQAGEIRAEFESFDGLMQFYIESGVGHDVWYGLQEGATHHWTFGADVSENANLKFCKGFGINVNTHFMIRNDEQAVCIANGTMANPSLSFIDDFDTGLYSITDDNLGLVTGGVEAIRITSAQKIRIKDTGTVTTPVLAFIDDTDTGIYSVSLDNIGLVTGGVEGLRITSSQKALFGSLGTVTNPTLSFIADTDTGIYSPGADNIGFVVGGVEKFRLTSVGNALLFGGTNASGASGVIGIGEVSSIPTSSPATGGQLYVEGGALKFRGSGDTVTTIAPA